MTIPESNLNSGRANEPKPSPELERLANIAYLLNVTQNIDSTVDRGITLGKSFIGGAIMRQIKFRGETFDGEIIYGGINDDGTAIVRGYTFTPVKPESVAQLVHHDKYFYKVYEGDKLKLDDPNYPDYEYEAYLKPLAQDEKHGCLTEPNRLVLKGAV